MLANASANAEATPEISFVIASSSGAFSSIDLIVSGISTAQQSVAAELLATSNRSSIWKAPLHGSVSGLVLKDVSGGATLLPKGLSNNDAKLFPTDNGLVISRGLSYSYLSAKVAASGGSETQLGIVGSAELGYTRQVMATLATDDGVYVSTVDIENASTNPALGSGHVWFLKGGASPVDSISLNGSYLSSLQLSPTSASAGFAILVSLGDTPSSDIVPISVDSNHVLTITGSTGTTAINAGVLSQSIAWATSGDKFVPIKLIRSIGGTVVRDRSGVALATYTSSANFLVASTVSQLSLGTAAANLITPLVTVTASSSRPLAYGAKITATASQSSVATGYEFNSAVPVSLVVKGVAKSLPASGLPVTQNFCLTAMSDSSVILKSVTSSKCLSVLHKLVANVTSAKKRTVALTTSASKVTVQVVKVTKKKSKVLTWISSPIKVKIKAGKAVVTFKTKGQYRFVAATTASNLTVTSNPVTFKK